MLRLLYILIIFLYPLSAMAGEVSDWVEEGNVRTRLIAGPIQADGSVMVGWEIELNKNWKTYWRSPGEAGLPPIINITGDNVAGFEMFHPLPERFELFGIQTFGYSDHVLFPIRVQLNSADMPLQFSANLSYMVCEDVCIPYKADISMGVSKLADPNGQDPEEDRVLGAMQQVPLTGMQAVLAGVEVLEVRIHGQPGWQTVEIWVKSSNHLAAADVIIEAGNEFRFKAPERQLFNDGTLVQLVYPVAGYEDDDLTEKDLRLTVTDGWGNAIETTYYQKTN